MSLSKEEREEMGRKGRKKIETSFDRQIIIQKYITELKKVEGAIR